MKKIISLVLLAITTGCSHLPISEKSETIDSRSSWIAAGRQGSWWIRSRQTESGTCPQVLLDDQPLEMQIRAIPTLTDNSFEDQVCEALVPVGTQKVQLGAQEWRLPLAPKRIVVVGDTGCRIKGKGDKAFIQNCNDQQQAWVFAKVSTAAAKMKPDLVIHVGDYLYREVSCPEGDPRCKGSPYGDTSASWSADFFNASKRLLNASPWIFMRGNHEDCKRAQFGFFRYFGMDSVTSKCIETVEPELFKFQNQSMLMMDSSSLGMLSTSLKNIKTMGLRDTWLLTHRPLLSGDDSVKKEWVGNLSGFSLLLAGHVHQFRITSFENHRPVQIITGNGGTKLEEKPMPDKPGELMNKQILANGFLVLEQNSNQQWRATEYDADGNAQLKCELKGTPANSFQCW